MSIDVAEREHLALGELTDRLTKVFAGTHEAERVHSTVTAIHQRFDDRPIRDFVPVFVERIARKELGGSA
ncbi:MULTISPECIES: three-helix bundle dimerization domain-containing protein [Streptosporangium]|uniref:Three-helix bundle dimerization domain-containing protein n=1 Tax=Streptosporangium vulgare TaxID=46190 RepID=A0ABV5TBF5_9ACTN